MDLLQVDREYHQDAPTPTELKAIGPGRTVRLKLQSGALFWARVSSGRRDNGTYTARAADKVPPVNSGDTVIFSPEHVFQVI